MTTVKTYLKNAVQLLSQLIEQPSLSGQEEKSCSVLEDFFLKREIPFTRKGNNLLLWNKFRDVTKPLIVLNSHHDTVKPVESWQRDPFRAENTGSRIYGLGSNDAGGPLVCLIQTFVHFYPKRDLPYQLALIASAEEEDFGDNGVSSVLKEFELSPDLAIIGEPTSLGMAVAEKGLLVVDATASGKSSHVAHSGGINALYTALDDIRNIREYRFEKVSSFLGKVTAQVTQIQAGTQHNVVPDTCKFVIDIRLNELYDHAEILNILRGICLSEIVPRSLNWRPSGIDVSHPVVEKARKMGIKLYGSPTLSDQVHFRCPSIKLGCGDSKRSHTADEYIEIEELENGIRTYIELLDGLELH